MTDLERKEEIKIPEEVKVIPEEVEIPEDLRKIEKKEGIQTTQTQFTAQVTDDNGKPLITTPRSQVVTITLPKGEEQLETLSKGSSENAIVWLAKQWLRTIKKALHFGWLVKRAD